MDPFVSIIISTYKSKTLRGVLRQLEEQTSKAFEVIVCDDGSNDFVKLERHSYPLRYVWHQDLGRHWSRTHNEGIALAKGRYTLFLHDDIIPHKELVERTLKLMQPGIFIAGIRDTVPRTFTSFINPEASVTGIDHRITLNKTIFNAYDYKDDTVLIPISKYFNDPFLLVSGCLMAFPTEALRKVGGCPEDYPGQGLEDYDLALRLLRNGYQLYLSYGLKGYHLDHPEMDGPEVDKNREEFFKRLKDSNYKTNFNYFELL